jgi:hypothetical protein
VDEAVPTFERDIRPLFRASDVRAMLSFFDLSSCEDVRRHAAQIYERLDLGSMPCDGLWPPEHVELFQRWIETGMAA